MTAGSTASRDRIRRLLAGVLLVLPLALVAVTWWLWRDGLPERVAFHWDARGRVDGTISAQPAALLSASVAAAAFLVGAVMLALPRVDPSTRRSAMYWLGVIGGFAAAAWLIPAGLTRAAGSAGDAALDGWLAGFLLPFVFGLGSLLLSPKGSPAPSRSPRPITMRPTEVGAWSRTVTTPMLYLAALALVVIVAITVMPALAAGDLEAASVLGVAVGVVALLAVLSFAWLRVTVDWRGLRVISLLTRLPLKRIPLDRIREIEISDLRPGEWGGWGYRVMPGRSAIILGGGPGLVVTTTDDKQFALSLRDPETPAGLLLALPGAAASGPGSD